LNFDAIYFEYVAVAFAGNHGVQWACRSCRIFGTVGAIPVRL